MPAKRSKVRNQKAKVRKKPFRLSPLQVLIIFSPVIVLTFFVVVTGLLILGWRSLEWNETSPPHTLTSKEYNNGRQYVIDRYGWETYTNKKYGFSIKYPKGGYIQDPECFKSGACRGKVIWGACGRGIKTDQLTRSSELITLDNMLGIIVNNYNGPIDDFIISQGGKPSDFSMTPQKFEGADEAVYALLKKTGINPPVPSIETPAYIIKQGGNIFQIAPLQNFGSEKGCLPPAGTGANSFDSKYWNIPESIKFL